MVVEGVGYFGEGVGEFYVGFVGFGEGVYGGMLGVEGMIGGGVDDGYVRFVKVVWMMVSFVVYGGFEYWVEGELIEDKGDLFFFGNIFVSFFDYFDEFFELFFVVVVVVNIDVEGVVFFF